MTRVGRIRRLLLAGVLALALFGPLAAQTSQSTDIAVVVHPATPVQELSLAEVRKVFRGDRPYWDAKLVVVLFVRAPVARERDVVLKVIFQMTEAQFTQYWIAKIFRAEAASVPKIMLSNDMANQFVATVPGGIAFMQAQDVGPGLRILRVDGRRPGEPGYALRSAGPNRKRRIH